MKLFLLLAIATLGSASAVLAAQDGERKLDFDAIRKRFDVDLDGRISRDEFPRGPAAFRRLDRDRDGFLTAADFERKSEKKPADATPASDGPAATPEQIAFFESKVRPVLASNCFGCHSASAPKIKGGLRVDSRAALLAGGSSGPALSPGDPDDSLFVRAVRYADADLQMPPKKQLDESAVRDLEAWVRMGAPWPEASTSSPSSASTAPAHAPIDLEKARQFWAFQAPKRVEPPVTSNTTWAWSPIDRFLLASMEAKGVAPVADADERTWLRRVTFDLTGLPPTPEELAAFDADRSDDAHAKVVDRLLASKAYGERWGRHWLDVARYAESSGKDTNVFYPHAWRYRDWVIAEFNADAPYDEFLREQIAGDLLPASNDDERARHEIATGYLALGAKGHNTRDVRQFKLDVADEQIDALSQGMLGMTLACARCHDHKFDPIPTSDYYALAGIFLSTETCYGTLRGPGNLHPSDLVELPKGANVPDGPSMSPQQRASTQRARDAAQRIVDEAGGRMRDDGDGKDEKRDPQALVRLRNAREQLGILDDLLARFDEDGKPLASNRVAMGVEEGKGHDVAVLERGEVDKPGAIAKRGVPQVLATTPVSIAKGSGRRELADWIASPANPLTARVWANRVWLHLFGRGIVTTPDNFGASGQRPDHPELLDWLATELVANGWSTKKLVREIVLSHAYRLASADDAKAAKLDPELVTRWRMADRRLEGEAIRDAMLAAAGTLQKEPPVGSPIGTIEGTMQREELLGALLQDRPVRSVYLPSLRDRLPDALEVFDAPDSAFVSGDRDETNVATQALYLMNDDDVLAAADAFAARLLASNGKDEDRIVLAFELALGRKPTLTESDAARKFLRDFEKLAAKPSEKTADDKRDDERPGRNGRDARRGRDRERPRASASSDPRRAAWSAFAQSLFESAEFRYVG